MNMVFSWSSGKDSAMALYDCLSHSHFQVKALWTTVNETNRSIPFHGVDTALLKKQADAIGIPLTITNLPDNCTNKQYEKLVRMQYKSFRKEGMEGVAFADLYLEDIRHYRNSLLQDYQLKAIYPIWKQSTLHTAKRFLANGFKAIITTVDETNLQSDWVGEHFDETFLKAIPEHVDPCGENGEFHTFVYDGPIFSKAVSFDIQEIRKKGSFHTARLTSKSKR
ncbi:diphthine--ammonia ligase [Bacillus hwajinpoensis]|uniref:Diphthine--ammonia ligase n=1 Tax=Guptibacillus hwajinpoensis TaxID=208199 RepID=A0A845F194_9BACL|nr:diphthine--ammonia ligase [Pseudalkalibacillus hwajinpoensis]MYL64742.1 diphthine--ammonia ligase [Pseudalkalibacillus hwajinpoensis]